MSNLIWDSLFIQGNIIIFKTILAIFNLLKTELMGKNCLEEINTIFEENTKYINDFNFINYYLILKKFEFNYKIIQINRRELDKKITETINNTNRFNLERNKKNKEENRKASFVKNINECYEEWPICIYDNEYKYKIVKYFHFMIHPDKIKIISDYFFSEIGELFSDKESLQNNKSVNANIYNALEKIEEGLKNKHQNNNNLDNKLRVTCCNKDKFKNLNTKTCMFSDSNFSELEIYKELLIERRQHYCNIKKHFTDSIPRITINSNINNNVNCNKNPFKSSFSDSVHSADSKIYKNDLANNSNDNSSWLICNNSEKSHNIESQNSNGSIANFTCDASKTFLLINRNSFQLFIHLLIYLKLYGLIFCLKKGNKIKDLLKSNEGDFMFPKTEANLFMMMNNVRNCKSIFL